jgi:hypothetical protein
MSSTVRLFVSLTRSGDGQYGHQSDPSQRRLTIP